MKCSFSDGLPEDCQKTSRRLPEDQQKTARRPPEDHQKTARRPPEDCQKTTRRPLAVFWQSSNTMIQGNFYKRLYDRNLQKHKHLSGISTVL